MNVTYDKLADAMNAKPKTADEWRAERPDMLEYLYDEYLKKLDETESELTDEAKSMFKSFIEFCRFQLKLNPAIGMCMLEQGLGFKLADSREVPLVALEPIRALPSGVMPITNPPMFPAANSITDTRCFPITKG